MAWTKEEVTDFQKENGKKLADINASLRPDNKQTNGKIGIFLPGQNGDVMTAMSVLKYRDRLWPDKEIVWFINQPNADLLRYAPINEVRPWPWAGNGLPEGCPDFYPLLCTKDNKLDQTKKLDYELTADLDEGYFPAPHQLSVEERDGIDYPNCSRKIFRIDRDWEWHPLLSFSDNEIEKIQGFVRDIEFEKIIIMEVDCGSGQSIWNDEMTNESIRICRELWGNCAFIFASKSKYSSNEYKNLKGFQCVDASFLSVRQTSLLIDDCDLMICISSGISVATSRWGSRPVPKIQFCGSFQCSTVTLATGPIELITHDGKHPDSAKAEFYDRLKTMLIKLK